MLRSPLPPDVEASLPAAARRLLQPGGQPSESLDRLDRSYREVTRRRERMQAESHLFSQQEVQQVQGLEGLLAQERRRRWYQEFVKEPLRSELGALGRRVEALKGSAGAGRDPDAARAELDALSRRVEQLDHALGGDPDWDDVGFGFGWVAGWSDV
jgi:hypothetical protein